MLFDGEERFKKMYSQKKIGVILSYLAQIVHILTSLVYVPILLRLLGQGEYGLYQLASATISNLSILTLGFNSAYIRFFSRAKSKSDNETEIAKLNGMFLLIFSVLSLVCLICGFVISINASFIFESNLSIDELIKVRVLMMILSISMGISFISSVFQSQISVSERFGWLKGLDLLSYILNPVISIPLLIMGYGSVALVVVSLIITLSTCVINAIYSIRSLNTKYCFSGLEFSLFKEMSGFTFYVFINIIIEQINWSLDKFLLGRMLGTIPVAVYSVGGQIVSLFRSISGSIRSVFIPQINRMIFNDETLSSINLLFTKLGRINFMIVWLIFSGFLLFGKEFIFYWAGEGYYKSYWCALLPMIGLLVPLIQSSGIDIQRAMNKHRARSIVYAFIAVGNLFFSILLINQYGEIGAALGTAIALILGQGLFMNFYYHKKLGLNMVMFWRKICVLFPCCLISLFIGYVIKSYIFQHNVISLLICILLYSFVYICVLTLFGINSYEKQLINKTISKIIKK